VPFLQAAKSVLLVDALRRMGIRWAITSLVVLLSLIGLSSLTLGSVPESFPLSATCMVLVTWFVACELTSRAIPMVAWLGACALRAGITLTNLGVTGIALVASLALGRRLSWVASLWQTGLVVGAGAALCVTLAVAGSIAYRQDVSELAPRSAGDLGQVRAGVSLLTDLP